MDGSRRDAMADLDPTVRDLVNGRRKGQRKKQREGARYPSEEGRVKGTWDLRPETLERVRAAAKELGVAQYALVEKLILDGLDRWEKGELELRVKMVQVPGGFE